jgi:hypothetical protein
VTALHEVAPKARRLVTDERVRALALVEVALGVTLALPVVHTAAAAGASLLAACFIVVGLRGRLRGASASCGCLGIRSTAPLGVGNMAVGAGLMVAVTLAPAVPSARDGGTVLAAAAVLILAFILWENRKEARKVLNYFMGAGTNGEA